MLYINRVDKNPYSYTDKKIFMPKQILCSFNHINTMAMCYPCLNKSLNVYLFILRISHIRGRKNRYNTFWS